jgi:hypothetical protein
VTTNIKYTTVCLVNICVQATTSLRIIETKQDRKGQPRDDLQPNPITVQSEKFCNLYKKKFLAVWFFSLIFNVVYATFSDPFRLTYKEIMFHFWQTSFDVLRREEIPYVVNILNEKKNTRRNVSMRKSTYKDPFLKSKVNYKLA